MAGPNSKSTGNRPSGFNVVLTNRVEPDDVVWAFKNLQLPKLPPNVTDDSGEKIWIKVLTVTVQNLSLKYDKQPTNRVLSADPNPNFILISFAGFRFPNAPPKTTWDYIERLLNAGVRLNGILYLFYGHSNSQLKSKTCYLYAAHNQEVISAKISTFGDFSKLNSVAKRAKRIGLLFSAAEASLLLKAEHTEDVPDVENNGHLFTDGCGRLSRDFAMELARARKVRFHNQRYVPSAFQIRYKGYKGMLMMSPGLSKKVSFRESMRKFKGCSNDTFSVLDYSKPFTYAYLNGELVTLLSALGIPDETFVRKQDGYFGFLKQARADPLTAFQFLCYRSMPDLAEEVLLGGLTEGLKGRLRKLVKEEWFRSFKELPSGEKTEKVKILIQDSRILFGVCDYTGTLKEGECQVRITTETGGTRTLLGAEVIVSRNPALHPGDIRKFRTAQVPELAHLVDCIVFPIVGRRDAASLMSGGDLDGDKFFVSWDPSIIPSTLSEPYGYPPAKEAPRRTITQKDMIRYFAAYSNASLGRVKNLYLDWARARPDSVLSKECQELNSLFSSCVDGGRIVVPKHLESPPKPDPAAKPFILDLLADNVKRVSRNFLEEDLTSLTDHSSIELLRELLTSDNLALLHEYELFSITVRWCMRNHCSIEDFLPYFDFGAFSALQKNAVLSTLTEEDPDLRSLYIGPIYNALHQSQFLSVHELKQQNLDYHGLRWQRLYASYEDEGSLLYSSMEKAMTDFERKLVVFRVDEQLTVAMYVPKRVEKGKDVPFPIRNAVSHSKKAGKVLVKDVSDCVRVFTFQPQSRTSYKATTTYGYKLLYDEEFFQLYDKTKVNTFIWFGLNDKFSRRAGITTPGSEYKVSIALQKADSVLALTHHRVTKQEASGIEIYVISNRDLEGHQILDITMSQVNTIETKRILQNLPRDYELGDESNVGVDWKYREFCKSIIIDGNLDHLAWLQTDSELEQVINVCIGSYNEKALFLIVDSLLKEPRRRNFMNGSKLREILPINPSLCILIVPALEDKERPWSSVDKDFLLVCLISVLISTNEIREAGLLLFQRLLAYMNAERILLSVAEAVDLTRRILFTVRHAELAQELILEVLDPEGERSESAEFEYARRFTLALAMDYLGESKELCPVDSVGIPVGAEEFGRSGPTEPFKNHLLNPSKLAEFLPGCFQDSNSSEIPPSSSTGKSALEPHQICLEVVPSAETPGIYETILRTDIVSKVRNEDHVRFCASKRSSDQPRKRITVFDALVTSLKGGKMGFRILQSEPLELTSASWNLYLCGSTTNLNTQLTAIKVILEKQARATAGFSDVLGSSVENPETKFQREAVQLPAGKFNESQGRAIEEAVNSPLTLIWGPPGTGKTTVVVEIIMQLLKLRPGLRLLVTASTHNAVDNVMERFLEARRRGGDPDSEDSIRLTSEISKVSPALKKWTLDAFVGKDIHGNDKARAEALKKLKLATLVFSTCSGAGVGLLRVPEKNSVLTVHPVEKKKGSKKSEQTFDIVIVDEATQVTEPNALIPIVKGSRYVVLVGDHVQLSPTVTEIGKTYGLDQSLFERLYKGKAGIASKVMLDVQYRMHPALAAFPSARFYEGKLKTGITKERRLMPESFFPWPKMGENPTETCPCVFINCSSPESYGDSSKSNKGQVEAVMSVLRLLRSGATVKPVINVLAPYTKQVGLMAEKVKSSGYAGVEVNTIDGFQGREADIVIFSTVRANVHNVLGFLTDFRRINVALTRAKYGIIIVGHEETLNGDEITKAMIGSCLKVKVEDILEAGKAAEKQQWMK